MAATYSSFMTTRYYSPVFNTALFDGPFRIYFSQSYESAALKIYHLLQTQYQDLWAELKHWSVESKEHVFLLMYPEDQDVQAVFSGQLEQSQNRKIVKMQTWEEGIALGISQPSSDLDVVEQIEQINLILKNWILKQPQQDILL